MRAVRCVRHIWTKSLANENDFWSRQIQLVKKSPRGKRQSLKTTELVNWRLGSKDQRWLNVTRRVIRNALDLTWGFRKLG